MNVLAIRTDPDAATTHLCGLWPERALLRAVAIVIARSIRYAHEQGPACWELTLFKKFLRLNVGQIAVLELFPTDLVLYTVAGPVPSGRSYRRLKFDGYRAVAVPTQRLEISIHEASALDSGVTKRHRELVAVAARAKRVSPFKRSHSPGAATAIERLAKCQLPRPDYVTAGCDRPDADDKVEHRAGGMFGLPLENAEVERTAVKVVTSRMTADGWRVRSVERDGCGYDLHCQRGRKVRHVEVKGMRGDPTQFVITAGEVRRADTDPAFRLVVVGNAMSGDPILQEYPGRSFEHAFQLEPLQYIARRTTT